MRDLGLARLAFLTLAAAVLGCGDDAAMPADAGRAPVDAGRKLDLGTVSSGFAQDEDAFQFPNFGGESPDSQVEPSQLPRMFGADKVCEGGSDTCNLTPIAGEFLASVNRSMTGGRCEGFAVLAGLMFLGEVDVGQYGALRAHELQLDGNAALGGEIAYWYSTQFLKDVVKAATMKLSGAEAVKFLAAEYEKPDHDLYRLGIVRIEFGRRTGGHAILATGVEPGKKPDEYLIHVYDNNHPEAERSIVVNVEDDTWEYSASTNPDQPGSLYRGDASNRNKIFLSAITPRLGMHECSFCSGMERKDMKALNQLFGFGSAEVTVKDSEGRTTGETAGVVSDEIPDSLVTPAFTQNTSTPGLWVDPGPLLMLFPAKEAVEITLTGTAKSEGSSGVALFANGQLVALESANVEEGESAVLAVDSSGTNVTYTPAEGSGGSFVVASETDGGGQTLLRTDVPSSADSLSIDVDPMSGNATIRATGMGDAMLVVECQKYDGDGTSTFGAEVPVSDGGATTLLVEDWKGGDDAMPVEVDTDGDGTPEQMMMLTDTTPEAPRSCANTILDCGVSGACTDGAAGLACQCNAGYAGPNCATCADGYSDPGNGTCVTSSCDMLGDCSGHGTCTSEGGRAVCVCEPGYVGGRCEIAVVNDPCMPNPCGANGTCVAEGTSFTCECASGYKGSDCAACASGYYRDGDACVACSGACPAGKYESAACSATANRVCSTCSGACPAGEYEAAACSGTANRVCSACTSVSQCASSVTCAGAADSQCSTCNAEYYLVDGTVDVCTACAGTCSTGQYESVACGGTANRVCSACASVSQCASSITCTGAADSQCTMCNPSYYLVDGTVDTCAACSGACGAGQYESAACSPTADRVCSACTSISQCASSVTCTGAADSQCAMCNAGYALVNATADTCVAAAEALDFDGVDDQVTIANDGTFDFTTGTVQLWFKQVLGSGGNEVVLSMRTDANTATRWSLHINDSADQIGLWNGSAYTTQTQTIATGTWYQLTAVFSPGSTDLYVNGASIGAVGALNSSVTMRSLVIGSPNDPPFASEWYTGQVDEVRVWNRALSAMEIMDTYNCELFSGTGLIASYQFHQGVPSGANTTETTLLDTSGNAHDGMLANFALSGSSSNWVSPGGVTTGNTCP